MDSRKILSVIFITILFCCKDVKNQEQKNDAYNTERKNDFCMTKTEKEKLVETILNTEDFQMFLHPDVEGRLTVRLQKNEFITGDLNIKSNGLPVILKDSLDLPYGSVHRLRIIFMDCENQKFSYSIFYPIEGAIITGTIKKTDTLWLVSDTNWGIKD